jgi:hypothetical protein
LLVERPTASLEPSALLGSGHARQQEARATGVVDAHQALVGPAVAAALQGVGATGALRALDLLAGDGFTGAVESLEAPVERRAAAHTVGLVVRAPVIGLLLERDTPRCGSACLGTTVGIEWGEGRVLNLDVMRLYRLRKVYRLSC